MIRKIRDSSIIPATLSNQTHRQTIVHKTAHLTQEIRSILKSRDKLHLYKSLSPSAQTTTKQVKIRAKLQKSKLLKDELRRELELVPELNQ